MWSFLEKFFELDRRSGPPRPAPNPPPRPKGKKKSKKFSFTYSPQRDITTYELAKVVGILEWYRNFKNILTEDGLKVKIESYPPEIQRHFKITEGE